VWIQPEYAGIAGVVVGIAGVVAGIAGLAGIRSANSSRVRGANLNCMGWEMMNAGVAGVVAGVAESLAKRRENTSRRAPRANSRGRRSRTGAGRALVVLADALRALSCASVGVWCMRQRTSAYVGIRQQQRALSCASVNVWCMRQRTSAYVGIRQQQRGLSCAPVGRGECVRIRRQKTKTAPARGAGTGRQGLL
jgi:hypothetical protein